MKRPALGSLLRTAAGVAVLHVPTTPLIAQAAPAPAAPAPAATAPTTTRPAATAPAQAATTTAPAPIGPLPSPKAVALAFVTSLEKGDATVARALVPGEEQVPWVDASLNLAAALKRLDAAAVARFGEAGHAVSQGQLHLADSLKAIEKAQEKVEGDAATLTLPGGAKPVRLVRLAGTWRVAGPSTAAEAREQVALYEGLARAADLTAGEIAAGAYANAAAAARRFAQRVTEARLGV
jgi:hypothetical protein